MTVRYLTRSASARGNYEPGDIVNIPDDLGKLLIKAGSVEKVETKTEPKKPEKKTIEKKAVTEPDEKATMPPPKRRRSTNKE